MEGTIFKYGTKGSHVAFLSKSSKNHTRHVVAVGGLTCGLLFSEYLAPLAKKLDEMGYGMVQPLMASSHQGWGCSSVEKDALELLSVVQKLKRSYSCEEFIILGHSTGCQDAVMYARNHKEAEFAPTLKGVILQGPVSDREFFSTFPGAEDKLKICKSMVEQGKGKDIAFRMYEFDGAPVSADRWLALTEKYGQDDMFSSDFTDDELEQSLSALQGIPTLVLMSGGDECQVPMGIRPEAIGNRLVAALGGSGRLCVIPNGSHDLGEHALEAVYEISKFVQSISD